MPKSGIFRHFYTLSTSTRRDLSKNALKTKHSKLTEKKVPKICKNPEKSTPNQSRQAKISASWTNNVRVFLQGITTRQHPQSIHYSGMHTHSLTIYFTNVESVELLCDMMQQLRCWRSSCAARRGRLLPFSRMNRPLFIIIRHVYMMHLTKTHALKVSTRDGRTRLDTWYDMHTNHDEMLSLSPNLQDTGSM